VKVDLGTGASEQPVLEPLRLPDSQLITGVLQVGDIGRLIGGIRHLEGDVDDRLGDQARHRGRTDVFEPERA
jgi:hypothetical protein